jgi:hypothetical protein
MELQRPPSHIFSSSWFTGHAENLVPAIFQSMAPSPGRLNRVLSVGIATIVKRVRKEQGAGRRGNEGRARADEAHTVYSTVQPKRAPL